MRNFPFSLLCRAFFLGIFCIIVSTTVLSAINAHAADVKSTFTSASPSNGASLNRSDFDDTQLDNLDQQVRRARIQMDIGNTRQALIALRTAAARSWEILYAISGIHYATTSDALPATPQLNRAARAAARAHYWWAMAARRSNLSDEAITAFARAARLNPSQNATDTSLHFIDELKQSLQNGFPQLAAPDVLNNIAKYAYSDAHIKSTFNASSSDKSTFLYTEGILQTPATMPKVAPLYRNIPEVQLPDELRSPHILYIYAKPQSKNLASLQVVVRYNDQKYFSLATQLAQTMAQLKLLNDRLLERPTEPITLWLETVTANWPNAPGENAPWEAAAKIDSAPRDIMIFRIDQPRSDVEWFRELQHEYGHVAWPNFSQFAPPLEPNANGLIAETLGMLWQNTTSLAKKDIPSEARQHIQSNAINALQQWTHDGPNSPLQKGNNEEALHYLQGFCVYLDRVYGTDMFCDVISNLYNGDNSTDNGIAEFIRLIDSSISSSRDIYLPAAATVAPTNLKAFVERSPVSFAPNSTREFLIYLPPGAQQLVIPWQGNGQIHNKSTFGKSVLKEQEITINLNGASGWNTLTLQFSGDVNLGAAHLK